MTIPPVQHLRIGIDCGGTNTDAVILDLTPGAQHKVLAATKTPTTPEVTHGIQKATSTVLSMIDDQARRNIKAVSIGTTHFVNALVQRSADRLERVAVIRLCGPFSRTTPPFAGFPFELRELLEGPHFFVEGGLQIDGSEISEINHREIEAACEKIKRQNIRTVAISAVYAPIDFTIQQEERVEAIIKQCLPDAFVTVSKRVANIGLLERENAAILNASLLPFATHTVYGFRTAAKALGLTCPVFVTGNDGTLLTLDQAAELPIRTFSSGPTNSMRGASYLASLADPNAEKETALVVDVGGTTTEVGVLLPSGFPRQAASHHELCGVMLNFAMPHVTSIGLGGGSIVRSDHVKTTVGPDSVGYKILDESIVFGGNILTATDIAVAAGKVNIGDASLVESLPSEMVNGAIARIKTMLELTIDSMKTSVADVPLYLVGGGAILVPNELAGVSKIHRFPYYSSANAVGAAIAQVAGSIDTVENTEGKTTAQVRKEVEARAIQLAIESGAQPDTVTIIESEAIPVAYVAGKCRFVVKAAGEWGNVDDRTLVESKHTSPPPMRLNHRLNLGREDPTWLASEILTYRPRVENDAWYLSEIDVEWIHIGAYILGCGGGGDPSHAFLACRELIRNGHDIRVVDINSCNNNKLFGWGGVMGSPEVIGERLLGEEYGHAITKLYQFLGIEKVGGLIACEIGGTNGMINMIAGASNALDLPVLDGDFMGRAYPTSWQTTPNVYDDGHRGENLLPICISSGDGNLMFMTEAKRYQAIDASLRAACTEMGTLVGEAHRPLSLDFCRRALVKNTISLSWRIGRAVMLANKQSRVGQVGKIVIDAIGGPKTGKVLFAGKVVEVSRKVYKGHSIGEIVIAALSQDEESDDSGVKWQGVLKIPFKNENLYAEHVVDGKSTLVATVPDLIAVLDAGNGRALGTPDYKYGQRVLVLGVTAAPQWTETKRGLEIGDLSAFGFDNIPYQPLGIYVEPQSVIDEFK